jgi:hypothetical protein
MKHTTPTTQSTLMRTVLDKENAKLKNQIQMIEVKIVFLMF